MKNKTLVIAILFAILSLAFAFKAQAQAFSKEDINIEQNYNSSITVGEVTELLSFELGAKETYTVSGFRIIPQGGAWDENFQATIYLLSDDGKILGSASKSETNRDGEYVVNTNTVITKGVPQKIRVMISADYWGNNIADLGDLNFIIVSERISGPDYFTASLYAQTSWFALVYNNGDDGYRSFSINASNANIKPVLKVAERNYLGGIRLSAYGDKFFLWFKPTFRIYFSGGKVKDIYSLRLIDEVGQVVAKNPKVSDCGEYALVEFDGPIMVRKGETSVFVHGSFGKTFAKEGKATLVVVANDIRFPIGISGKLATTYLWQKLLPAGSVSIK